MLATWELEGAHELAAALEQAPAIAREKLEEFMQAATLFLEGEIRERTPAAHGTLKQSITSDVESSGDSVIGVVGSPLSYAVPVELGTRPHFPPVDALLDWVRVKLGTPEAEARSVAFLVARKIAAKGTEGAFMVRDAFEAGQAELERQARLMLEDLKRALLGGA